MEGENHWERPKKTFDKKTGREVLTIPPHASFAWKPGYVLRSIEDGNADRDYSQVETAIIGGDRFEWVPTNEVEIEEK